MKSFLSVLTITSLVASAFAAPVEVEKRACPNAVNTDQEPQVAGYLSSLNTQLQPIFSSIADAHTTFLSNKDTAAATTSYSGAVSQIQSAFGATQSQVSGLTGLTNDQVKSQYADCLSGIDAVSLKKRQTPGGLQAELEAILQELTTALQTIVGDLGLTGALAFLNPLLASLGGLLLSLVPVVNNLLALVQQLLDGLLIGLGLGLGGIVL